MSGEIAIRLNGEVLLSSKLDATVEKSWRIGSELGFTKFEVQSDDLESKDTIEFVVGKETRDGTEYEYIEIPEIGRVTGTITLYQDKISGGKAEERGFSNGFLVNVFGACGQSG